METSVKERIKLFVKHKGISIREFERRCGMSTGYMAMLRHAPGANKLSTILAQYPELSRVWLLTGEGEMLVSAQPAERQEESPATIQMQPVDGSEVISRLLEMIREKDAIIMRQAETIGALKHKIKVLSDSGDNK